jgi:multiple antibiotic resistance protein
MTELHLHETILFATSLIAIVNPISSAVLFASMAGRFGASIERRMANQSAFAILVILLACAWAGRFLLQVLGISVPMRRRRADSFPVMRDEDGHGGGAEATPRSRCRRRKPEALEGSRCAARDSGHGRRGHHHHVVVAATTYPHLRDLSIITVVCALTALVMWVTFRSAGPIARQLGPTGLNVVTRVMGILVSATAFGLLARGLVGLMPGLGH